MPELALRILGRGSSRYSTNRQPQKAIWRVSVVTQTMIDRQNIQPGDRLSRLIVQRGMEMESGLSVDSSITCPIGRIAKNLKPMTTRQSVPGMPTNAYV